MNNLSHLANLTNLQSVFADNNNITDIVALENLTNLRELVLYSNSISDISIISKLLDIEILDLSYNKKKFDLNIISDLTKLRYLSLIGNDITDISFLSSLTSLENLLLNDNSIQDIEPLKQLTNLYGLTLFNQNIINDKIYFNNDIKVAVKLKDEIGNSIAPKTISNSGKYNNNVIEWKLPKYIPSTSYTFYHNITSIGYVMNVDFSRTVKQQYEYKDNENNNNENNNIDNNSINDELPKTGNSSNIILYALISLFGLLSFKLRDKISI